MAGVAEVDPHPAPAVDGVVDGTPHQHVVERRNLGVEGEETRAQERAGLDQSLPPRVGRDPAEARYRDAHDHDVGDVELAPLEHHEVQGIIATDHHIHPIQQARGGPLVIGVGLQPELHAPPPALDAVRAVANRLVPKGHPRPLDFLPWDRGRQGHRHPVAEHRVAGIQLQDQLQGPLGRDAGHVVGASLHERARPLQPMQDIAQRGRRRRGKDPLQ